MKKFDTCIDCEVKLKKTLVEYKGTRLEALQCPKCKQKIFTEEQSLKAINTLAGLWRDIRETGQEYQNKLRKRRIK